MSDLCPPPNAEQSAVIAYGRMWGQLFVSLITSSSGRQWILPKGFIEGDDDAMRSAAREAWEEAGLVGYVGRDVVYEYERRKYRVPTRVRVYAMLVTEVHADYPERAQRRRIWTPHGNAAELVSPRRLAGCLRDLPRILGSMPDPRRGGVLWAPEKVSD